MSQMRMLRLNKKAGIKLALCLLPVLAAGAMLDRFIFPLPLDRLNKPAATFVYSRNGNLMGCYISPDGYWRKPAKLNEISPLLQ
jgi:membrane carboxypeptidase/penicillin-binding protein PbpC